LASAARTLSIALVPLDFIDGDGFHPLQRLPQPEQVGLPLPRARMVVSRTVDEPLATNAARSTDAGLVVGDTIEKNPSLRLVGDW